MFSYSLLARSNTLMLIRITKYFFASFSCNSISYSGCSALPVVKPNLKKNQKTCVNLWLKVYSISMAHAAKSLEYL